MREQTVLVVRTYRVEETLAFFQGLGLTFVQEQHGNGPVHYACQVGDRVFEIYPQTREGMSDFVTEFR